MNINFPDTSQIPALRTLWKEAFGDTDDFINNFFKTAFSLKRCRCVTADEKIVAALYWFDCQYMNQPVAYIYAVATANSHRGQGICHKLMANTHLYLKECGYECVLLMPGNNELFHFYKKIGYQPCSTIREFSCKAQTEDLTILSIDKTEYARLRKFLLPPQSIIQEKENLDFLQTQATFYMGLGFLLAARIENNTLYGLEILGNYNAAPAILHTLGYEKGIFRTPGHNKPFTMYYPLQTTSLPAPNYFAFTFD